MILINFAFLGDTVKVTAEGERCMNELYQFNADLIKMRQLNDSLLDRDGAEFQDAYKWCKDNCSAKNRRGRNTFFAF